MCLLKVKLSDRNFCLPSAVRFKRFIFCWKWILLTLKNGHVIPKFWVLINLVLIKIQLFEFTNSLNFLSKINR